MIGDQMFQADNFQLKLSCAHNHPDQVQGDVCKLCGANVAVGESNERIRSESG